jgi:hypothetical protein
MTDPRYPIGKLQVSLPLTAEQRRTAIAEIAGAPAALRRALDGLDGAQLDTPYREGGWTVRQLVHHVADSHLNAYTRLRFALTEENPTVMSLALLDALHARWTLLLESLGPDDFERPLTHSASGPHNVDWLVAIYSWHGRHHTAHVTALRQAKNW